MKKRHALHDQPDKELLDRLARIEGQVRGIARMVSGSIYCIDILNRIQAVKAALKKVSSTCSRSTPHIASRMRSRPVMPKTRPRNSMNSSNCSAAMETDTPSIDRDPVCGMAVNPTTAVHRADQAGHTYYFCSAKCRETFSANPSLYTNGHQHANRTQGQEHLHRALSAPAHGTIYTCPMHPEIRQDRPGSCPICGMALEPLVATGEHIHNLELADMWRRFLIGVVLAIPVVVLGMGGELVGLNQFIPPALSPWLQFALSTPVVLWAWLAILPARLAVACHLGKFQNVQLIAMGTGGGHSTASSSC